MHGARAVTLVVSVVLTSAAQTPAASAASGIPFRKEAALSFDSGRWAAGVMAALLVAGGVLWWMRRRLPSAPTGARRMRVQESLRISPRTTLLLMEIDGRTAAGRTGGRVDPAGAARAGA